MAKCVHCGVDTELWDAGVPKCIACSDPRDPTKTKLRDRAKQQAANDEKNVKSKPLDPFAPSLSVGKWNRTC